MLLDMSAERVEACHIQAMLLQDADHSCLRTAPEKRCVGRLKFCCSDV